MLLLSTFAFSPGASAAPAASTAAVSPALTAPAPAAPAGRFDETELRRGAGPGRDTDRAAGSKPGADATSPSYDLPRVLTALTAVVALIFLLRWAARRFFALPTARASSQVVQVLSRSVLSPKQQLLLVKVGRRVLVAADNGSQLSALSEITDPDEVAALVGQLRSEKDAGALGLSGASTAKAFNTLFGRIKKKYDTEDPAEADPGEADHDGYRRNRHSAARDEEDGEADEQDEVDETVGEEDSVERPGYPAGRAGTDVYPPPGSAARSRAASDREEAEANVVAATRQELSGLLEKVRLVSDQFHRSKETRK